MVALETPKAELGWLAEDFSLPATDGKQYSLNDLRGRNGLLVMFICNHCPYVQKQMTRMVRIAKQLQVMDVGVVAISSNDAENYPEDSFENMKKVAAEQGFCFPYLYDESQAVAQSYGAVCTPDFFGFNADLELQFRGRIDTSWSGIESNPTPELLPAMQDIVRFGKTDREQNPSVGCSIKWKEGAVKRA